MPAELPARHKLETWREWQPDPEEDHPFYTREQLVSRLQRLGHDVTPNKIRHWQAVGAIPGPTRQWYGSAVHALYPEWLLNLIPHLIRFRQEGMPWPEVRERLRAMVPEMIARWSGVTATVTPGPQLTATVAAVHVRDTAEINTATHPAEFTTLDEAVFAFAAHQEETTGAPIVRAELRLFDVDGRQRGRRTYNTRQRSARP